LPIIKKMSILDQLINSIGGEIMKTYLRFLLALAVIVAAAPSGLAAEIDRTVLPIPEPKRPLYTELDVRNATPPPRFEVKAPAGAPNVIVVLVDDLGFAGTSAFGGPVKTTTSPTWAGSSRPVRRFPGTPARYPTASPRWPRCCA